MFHHMNENPFASSTQCIVQHFTINIDSIAIKYKIYSLYFYTYLSACILRWFVSRNKK